MNYFALLDESKHLLRAFCCEYQSTFVGKEPVLKWALWLLQAGVNKSGKIKYTFKIHRRYTHPSFILLGMPMPVRKKNQSGEERRFKWISMWHRF